MLRVQHPRHGSTRRSMLEPSVDLLVSCTQHFQSLLEEKVAFNSLNLQQHLQDSCYYCRQV